MKKNIFRVLCLITFTSCILLVSPVWSATYYVKNSGYDSASGLSDIEAWRTISKVNSFNFVSGDTIFFKRGNIFDDGTLTLNGITKHITGITIGDYGTGSKPLFDGDAQQPIFIWKSYISNLTIRNIDISGQDWSAGKSMNLYVREVDGVVIDGVIGDGHKGGSMGEGKNAIYIRTCTGDIEIKNCTLYNWGPSTIPTAYKMGDIMGIAISSMTSGNIRIHDNVLHHINSDAIHVYLNTATTKIYDNEIYNAGENCIDLKGSSNCEIYENEFYRTSDFTGNGGSEDISHAMIGIAGQDGSDSNNNIVRDNYFHDYEYGIVVTGLYGRKAEGNKIYRNKFSNCGRNIKLGPSSKNTNISYNLIINPQSIVSYGRDMGGIFEYNDDNGSGNKIYNNTIYNNSGACKQLILLGKSNGTEVRNNIVYQNRSEGDAYCFYYYGNGNVPIVDHNCWYNKANNNIIYYKGVEYPVTKLNEWSANHPGALFEDPLFKNAGAGDFSLKDSSPCRMEDRILGAIDGGVSVIVPPQGVKVEFIKN